MNPTILFDGRLVLDKPTGIGQYIASILPELISQRPDWFFHVLLGPNPWPGYRLDELNSTHVQHHVSNIRPMSPVQYISIPRVARSIDVDLVHYPHMDAPLPLGGIPLISTIHDVKFISRNEAVSGLTSLKRRYLRLACRQTLKRAKAIIADSNHTADDLQREFNFDSSKLSVIPLAPDGAFDARLNIDGKEIPINYGIFRPFILSVGERRPHKNHVGLIEAYGSSQSHNSHDLVIIGQPHADYDAPEEKADELGIANQVYFLTDINHDALAAFYTAADLFVLVSFYEGFGLPILEAMACDTPVICSSTTASGEIGGDAAFLVDPYDVPAITNAIDRLIGDSTLANLHVKKGQEWRQNFSWSKTAEKTLAVYEKVLGNL